MKFYDESGNELPCPHIRVEEKERYYGLLCNFPRTRRCPDCGLTQEYPGHITDSPLWDVKFVNVIPWDGDWGKK